MLGVGFNDQLDIPVSAIFFGVDDINHHIGQSRLSARVQVYFGLLHEDDRSWRCIEALHENWQHLRDTKSDIRQIHPILRALGADLDFVFLSLVRDLVDFESLDQPHLL